MLDSNIWTCDNQKEHAEIPGSDVSERLGTVSERREVVWIEGQGNRSNSLDGLNVEEIEYLPSVHRKTH